MDRGHPVQFRDGGLRPLARAGDLQPDPDSAAGRVQGAGGPAAGPPVLQVHAV